jgi:hypothetical protein
MRLALQPEQTVGTCDSVERFDSFDRPVIELCRGIDRVDSTSSIFSIAGRGGSQVAERW